MAERNDSRKGRFQVSYTLKGTVERIYTETTDDPQELYREISNRGDTLVKSRIRETK